MRWVMITRKLDPADDRLGFVMRWVEALAARLDRLDVICQEHASPALPDNVALYSMGKESGVGRVGQAWRFTQHLRHLTRSADGVFCHMIPRYVWFAAPWTRLYRKPLLLWYTHRQISAELRVARALATHLITASPGSFPLPSEKIRVMGHGIEPDLFAPGARENQPPEIALVARLAHVKRQDWLLRAAAKARDDHRAPPFRVLIIGGPVESEPDYPQALAALARDLNLARCVEFTGPLPRDRVAALLGGCAIVANLSPPGLFDKAALEGMLTARPTLVANADFLPLLGAAADLLYLPETATDDDLAARLARLLALSPDERAALGADLRARVIAAHVLPGLMDRVVVLMREAVEASPG